MSIIDFLSRRAGTSPVVPAAPTRSPLNEGSELVQALLAFDPRGHAHGIVAFELGMRLLAAIPEAWEPGEDATPAEEYVHAARSYCRSYASSSAAQGLEKPRFNLEFAYARYLERDALRRFGTYPEYTLHAYTTAHGRTRVAVFLAGHEKGEPAIDLPGELDRTTVEDVLAHWYAGFLRGRRDGQADLRARAGAILSVIS